MMAATAQSKSLGFLKTFQLETYKILTLKPTEKRPLGRRKHRWEDVRIDLREIGVIVMYWIDLADDSPCEYSSKPLGSVSYGLS